MEIGRFDQILLHIYIVRSPTNTINVKDCKDVCMYGYMYVCYIFKAKTTGPILM